jgi:ABC-2 type transport system ATP-binding protein
MKARGVVKAVGGVGATSDKALIVKGLYKDFKLPHERQNSIKELVLHFGKSSYEEQHALRDISFEVTRGEFFGIVGRNGSGKSTLLKLIGGIYQPTKGSIQVNGTLTPFIELGIGFNAELTGRENVYLNGAILGLTRKEVAAKYDEIVDFAELHKFMDQKLKNYSSGMQVRLAFSIAIQAHNDILLIDEVLAVGDAAFQRKCYNVFKDMKRAGKTVIFVTHDMGAIQDFCDRALMIKDSEVIKIGKPREVALRYEMANSQDADQRRQQADRPVKPVVQLEDIHVGSAEKSGSNFDLHEDIYIDVDFTVRVPTAVQFSVFFVYPDGRYLAGANTTVAFEDFVPEVGKHTITCKIASGQLTKGEYRVNASLHTYCKFPSTEAPSLIDVLDSSYGYNSPRVTITEISPVANGEFNIQASWEKRDKGKA